MSFCNRFASAARRAALLFIATVVSLAAVDQAQGQFVSQQVGGVSIDARGMVNRVNIDQLNELKQHREQALQAVPGDLKRTALRKISLRQLEAAIAENRKTGAPLSDEMRYLAGMQRIQYVFIYPEQNDIVLAGPGEGWKLNADGEVVGITTHRPVMLLDDLVVALRSIEAAQQTGISCSIDPTSEGLARFNQAFKKNYVRGSDPTSLLPDLEQALGPQTISVLGVPETSHFARVLVAADYRMKRLAMAFEEPPIQGLPSFLHMVKTAGKPKSMMPRWWLAPAYDSLLADADGLAWELRGAGVKAMTEEEHLGADGKRERTGKADPLAQKWADNMTAHYDALSAKDSIFGQLRNCIDLAVVAALIHKENLTEKCGWSMPLLVNPELLVEQYNAPHQVDTQASIVQKSSGWVISASGGVQIVPQHLIEKTVPSAALGSVRAKSAAPTDSWWWN